MKKCLFFLLIFSFMLNAEDINIEDFYNKMKESQSTLYPKKFEADIKGEIVSKQIGTIAKGGYTKTKEDITLVFSFKQGNRATLTLYNVTSFYAGMFRVFEPILEATGFYASVGSSKNYSAFIKRFNVVSIEEKGNYYNAEIVKTDEGRTYTVYFKINKDTYLIEEAQYYRGKKQIYHVYIEYTEVNGFTVPSLLKYSSTDGDVNSDISFMNVRTFSK